LGLDEATKNRIFGHFGMVLIDVDMNSDFFCEKDPC
jgi:hypothetical protein